MDPLAPRATTLDLAPDPDTDLLPARPADPLERVLRAVLYLADQLAALAVVEVAVIPVPFALAAFTVAAARRAVRPDGVMGGFLVMRKPPVGVSTCDHRTAG